MTQKLTTIGHCTEPSTMSKAHTARPRNDNVKQFKQEN